MRDRIKFKTFMLGLIVLGFVCSASAGGMAGVSQMRINVGLVSDAAKSEVEGIFAGYGGRLVSEIPQLQTLTFVVPQQKVISVTDDLVLNGLVKFVEEDLERHIEIVGEITVVDNPASPGSGINAVPNDPNYPSQWGPPCIGAESAWNVVVGDANVIVAVIDTGVDWDHPDLAANVDTGIDYDFVNTDADAMDDNGHGTHVSGIIAAQIHNRTGVAGLQQITIMGVKGLNAQGSGSDSVLAQCIVYAVDNGARVINCSWGGTGFSSALLNAVNYAFDQGVIVIAAAGNSGVDTPHYPAAYPKVVGVAALQDCTTRASYSQWGHQNVKIAAPGSSVYSTYWNNIYAYATGTSMAAPHVAGVAAAYFSYNPAMSRTSVLRHMAINADDLGAPGVDPYYGYGRVDMYPPVD